MIETTKHPVLLLPPYRSTPETAQRIMATQVVVLLLPAFFAVMFFGYHALKLMLIASLAALITETICNKARHNIPPATTAHSVMMGLLLAFTLPAQCPTHIALIGAVAAVLIGKQLFGGLGHYLWHPALIGRLIVQLFFHEQLSASTGPVLLRSHIFFGNVTSISQTAQWLKFNWFTTAAPQGSAGFLLPESSAALRQFDDLHFVDSIAQFGRYLLDHLPPLSYCLTGAVPGGLGETCCLVLILVGLYFIYRGYLHWCLPLIFIGGAYAAAACLPIMVTRPEMGPTILWLPICLEDFATGFTYVNYHIFTGGLLLGAFVFTADMTSRPIAHRGQIIFAAGAGALTIVLRLYTPIAIPCYAAILAMNSLIPTLDRLARPTGSRRTTVFA